MSDESLEDTYPHWRDALFGNHSAAANVRCAIEYVFWHLVYGGIAVVGLALLGGIKLVELLAYIFDPLEDLFGPFVARAKQSLNRVANSDTAETVGAFLVGGMFVVGVLILVGILVYLAIFHFWEFVFWVGVWTGAIIGVFLLFEIYDRLKSPAKRGASSVGDTLHRAGERAVETPGVRRVYGRCPVSFHDAPKWFNKVFPEE